MASLFELFVAKWLCERIDYGEKRTEREKGDFDRLTH